jgi:hypothetical protein
MTTFRDDPRQVAGVAVLRSDNEFRLLSARGARAGDFLFFVEGELSRVPSRYTVQVDVDRHVDIPVGETLETTLDRYFWRFMNHSCDPSAVIRGREVFARRGLVPGEEITFNYNTTEYEMFEPFDCHCGHAACQGRVGGYRFLSSAGRAQLAATAAAHLLGVGDRV